MKPEQKQEKKQGDKQESIPAAASKTAPVTAPVTVPVEAGQHVPVPSDANARQNARQEMTKDEREAILQQALALSAGDERISTTLNSSALQADDEEEKKAKRVLARNAGALAGTAAAGGALTLNLPRIIAAITAFVLVGSGSVATVSYVVTSAQQNSAGVERFIPQATISFVSNESIDNINPQGANISVSAGTPLSWSITTGTGQTVAKGTGAEGSEIAAALKGLAVGSYVINIDVKNDADDQTVVAKREFSITKPPAK